MIDTRLAHLIEAAQIADNDRLDKNLIEYELREQTRQAERLAGKAQETSELAWREVAHYSLEISKKAVR